MSEKAVWDMTCYSTEPLCFFSLLTQEAILFVVPAFAEVPRSQNRFCRMALGLQSRFRRQSPLSQILPTAGKVFVLQGFRLLLTRLTSTIRKQGKVPAFALVSICIHLLVVLQSMYDRSLKTQIHTHHAYNICLTHFTPH